MTDSFLFRSAKKGLEPEDVDRTLNELNARIADAELRRDEANSTVERLSRELAEAQTALRRANTKPSFSDLGAAFEQTLRVAEEQAGKLLQDATNEVNGVLNSAREDADRILNSSQRQAAKVISEAEKRAEKTTEDSTRNANELLARADAALTEARAALAQAATDVARIDKKAVDDVAAIFEQANAEADQARKEIATLRELQTRDQQRIADEIAASRERAQRQSQKLMDESNEYIDSITAAAATQMAEAQLKEAHLRTEAEAHFTRSHNDADALLLSAQETAARLVERAQARADALNIQLQDRKQHILAEAAANLARIEEERERIVAFNEELRSLVPDDGLGE